MKALSLLYPFAGPSVMWSAKPITSLLRKALRLDSGALRDCAESTVEIAPGSQSMAPPAFHLPGQFESIRTFSEFSWSPAEERTRLAGGNLIRHSPTRALVLRNVLLIDGVLYKDGASSHLHRRGSRIPKLAVKREFDRASMYSTPQASRYFAHWIMDDCPTYGLTSTYGPAVTTLLPMSQHLLPYEAAFGMNPVRVESAFFKELVVFEDFGHNRSKRHRFAELGRKLRQGRPDTTHPGVFLLRGHSGVRRVMKNEREVAETLRDKRGFTIVDPSTSSVSEIVDACAGAQAVVGVEGSQLIHGLVMLPPGGSFLPIQPPDRYNAIYKDLTDRDQQKFGVVVGTPDGDDFHVSVTAVEQTLDLMSIG